MALWQGMVLTQQGRELHAKVEAGQTALNICKIKTGSYDHRKDLDNLVKLTDLKEPKQVVDLLTKEVQGSETYIHCAISNHDLHESYLVSEMGLYAQTDSGVILYGVMVANEPDLLSAHSDSRADETIEYDILLAVSSDAHISIKQPNDNSWVTFKYLAQAIDTHNTDENAHGGLLKKVNGAMETHRTNAELDHPDGSVHEKHLANDSVTADKIKNGSVGNLEIADKSVTTSKIQINSITNDRILDGAVTTDKIKDGTIVDKKIANKTIRPGSLDREYLEVEGMKNKIVTSFDGLKGDIKFHNYMTRLSPMAIGKMTGTQLAQLAPFRMYFGSDANKYLKGVSAYTVVECWKDSHGDDSNGDAWVMAYNHMGGHGTADNPPLIKYKHATTNTVLDSIDWLEIIDNVRLKQNIAKANITNGVNAVFKQATTDTNDKSNNVATTKFVHAVVEQKLANATAIVIKEYS